ncbi:MAG: DUF362 domain-containing protein [Candidatus Bathyarchaeia archaeon]|jgi:uncharacterized protein (DUF362 family)
MSVVSLVKIEKSNFKKAIEDSLNLLGYSFDRKIGEVVIKPNMCYYWDYSTGQTTDPKFVAALVDILREKTSVSDIALVESDASAMKCKYAFKFLGYEKLFKDSGVRLVNLSEEKSEEATVTCDGKSHNFQVPQIIKNADLRINLPKIKYTMKGIELTCSLKNIYGCNPYPQKSKYHPQLGNAIVSLNKAMKFDLCIIDGNIVSGIQPRKLGLVMASKDPVAIDAASAKIAGLNPRKIKYLKLANREGLGSVDFIPKGEPLNQFRAVYPKKNLKKKLMGQAYIWVVRLKLAKKLGIG